MGVVGGFPRIIGIGMAQSEKGRGMHLRQRCFLAPSFCTAAALIPLMSKPTQSTSQDYALSRFWSRPLTCACINCRLIWHPPHVRYSLMELALMIHCIARHVPVIVPLPTVDHYCTADPYLQAATNNTIEQLRFVRSDTITPGTLHASRCSSPQPRSQVD